MAVPSHGVKDAIASLYMPLVEDRDDIRLITFVQPSSKAGRVCCNIETVSLQDFTPEYREFAAVSAGDSKRKLLSKWARRSSKTVSSNVASSDMNQDGSPAKDCYRFAWGDFAALSYAWGEPDPTTTMEIIVNGQTMLVGRNLEVALRAVHSSREFENGYKLWVDALCINQDDLEERGCQVRKMRNIYGNAWTVIAWLGEDYQDSDKAFQLLHAMSEASQVDGAEKMADIPYTSNGQWLALHELMDRPYWYRLWIIQEVVLANSSLIIRCGNSFIDWGSFCLAIGFLYDHLWIAKDDYLFIDQKSAVDQVPDGAWSTTSLHLVHQDLWELTLLEEKGQGHFEFGRLLDLAQSTEARDTRDMVYGLVGMMGPTIADRLLPDYTSTSSEVFAKVARVFIETKGNLNPIREGNPWGDVGAPSWAADWTWNGRSRNGRLEGSTSWAEKGAPRGYISFPYRACGATLAEYNFSQNGQQLTCKGFIVDKIDGLSAREWGFKAWSRDSIVQPDNSVSIYGDSKKTSIAIYHTLMAGRDPDGQKSCERHQALLSLPSTYLTGWRQFRKLGWGFFLSIQAYYYRWERFRLTNMKFRIGDHHFDDYFTDTIPVDASEKDYLHAYSSFDRASKGRRLMTTLRGYLGWAPDNMYGSDEDQTQKGDLVVIIFGCDTPVVMRPFGENFQVLGGAYVQGLMDGEAVDLLAKDPEAFQVRDFVLC